MPTRAAIVTGASRGIGFAIAGHGIKSVAFCPGFVDTDMTELVKAQIPAEEMLRTSDITEALGFLLRVSPSCVASCSSVRERRSDPCRPGRARRMAGRGGIGPAAARAL
jgi:NAD(P)-dependent dehydrogenase (short-subunit alcohol dehydrogenase family)